MFKSLRKTLKLFFLLTLPLTLFPVLTGIFSGIIFSTWHTHHINSNVEKFVHEVRDSLNDWGVGGSAPSFRTFQDTHNDFHLLRLNSNDWTSKLNFLLPEEYTSFEDERMSIDKVADLETLAFDPTCNPKVPKEQWVILSNFAPFVLFNPWDRAFHEVVQRAYRDERLNQTKLHYMECLNTAGFLCGVWHARAPGLIHFEISDDPIDSDSDLTYSTTDISSLRKVTTRIIDLPLSDDEIYLNNPRNFPSEREQILSAMFHPEQFEPFSAEERTLKRFTEYIDSQYWDNAKNTYFHTFNTLDNWIMEHITTPLGIEELLGILHSLCFSISALVASLVLRIGNEVWFLAEEFLGRPRLGDRILGEVDLRAPEEKFWGGTFEDFFGDLMERLKKDGSDEEGPITSMAG